MKKIALIFAGGRGRRMKSDDLPKQFIEINDKPIIIHTLEYFQNNKNIDEICVVCLKDYISYCEELVNRFKINKVKYIIPGGETGQDSIYNGLKKIKENNKENSIVLIHDGVRPLINQDIINNAIECTINNGCAIPVIPCTETIVKKSGNKILDVPDRSESFVAQAPQAFFLEEIYEAHNTMRKMNPNYEGIIDSCTLYKKLDKDISVFDGLDQNIKITTQKDLYLLKALLEYQEKVVNKNE